MEAKSGYVECKVNLPILTYDLGKITGKTPRDTDLLLRDMLYLLQGIDGKYARFAKKSRFEKQKRLNPYLVDQAFPRPGGARDDKGKGKQVDEVLADDEEIRGIDFVDPDGQVRQVLGQCHVNGVSDGVFGNLDTAALRLAVTANDHRTTGRAGRAIQKSFQLHAEETRSVNTGSAERSKHD